MLQQGIKAIEEVLQGAAHGSQDTLVLLKALAEELLAKPLPQLFKLHSCKQNKKTFLPDRHKRDPSIQNSVWLGYLGIEFHFHYRPFFWKIQENSVFLSPCLTVVKLLKCC